MNLKYWFYFFGFGAILGHVQKLFLALASGITPDSTCGNIWGARN